MDSRLRRQVGDMSHELKQAAPDCSKRRRIEPPRREIDDLE